jgi:hypothetical protein
MIIGWKDGVTTPVLFSPWSLVHLATGAASRGYVSFYTGQALHIAYELVGSKAVFEAAGFTVKRPSSQLNSIGDHTSFTIGQNAPKGPWGFTMLALFSIFTYRGIEF